MILCVTVANVLSSIDSLFRHAFATCFYWKSLASRFYEFVRLRRIGAGFGDGFRGRGAAPACTESSRAICAASDAGSLGGLLARARSSAFCSVGVNGAVFRDGAPLRAKAKAIHS
jgi:hypothetical protein